MKQLIALLLLTTTSIWAQEAPEAEQEAVAALQEDQIAAAESDLSRDKRQMYEVSAFGIRRLDQGVVYKYVGGGRFHPYAEPYYSGIVGVAPSPLVGPAFGPTVPVPAVAPLPVAAPLPPPAVVPAAPAVVSGPLFAPPPPPPAVVGPAPVPVAGPVPGSIVVPPPPPAPPLIVQPPPVSRIEYVPVRRFYRPPPIVIPRPVHRTVNVVDEFKQRR